MLGKNKAGLPRTGKMGQQVREAVPEGFPETQGSKGNSILGVATVWCLESITSNGEGQQEKETGPGIRHSWEGGGS